MNDESKTWAFLGVFLGVIGFVIVLLAKKKDEYAMYYGKQGLVLFIVAVAVMIVGWIIGMIPFFGWMIYRLLSLGILVLWIIGIIYALSGEKKEIPLVGIIAKQIKV